MIPNRNHPKILIAVEDIRQGQLLYADSEGRVSIAKAEMPLQEQRFPTLEELKNYATQGLSLNRVARLCNLNSSDSIRVIVNQHPELKIQYLANGRANQSRRKPYA